MKKLVVLLVTLTLVSIMTNAVYPQENDSTNSKTSQTAIEDNYLHGLESDNFGVVTDCIYFLGKRQSKKAVEPLINILKDKYAYSAVRLMAALALLQIEDPEGVKAVRSVAEHCDCEQVKTLCNYFHNIHLWKYNYQNMVTELNDKKTKW